MQMSGFGCVPIKLIYKNRYHAYLTHEPWFANPHSRDCCWKDWELPCYAKLYHLGILLELKAPDKQQMQENFSDLHLSTEKQIIKFPVRKEPSLYQ